VPLSGYRFPTRRSWISKTKYEFGGTSMVIDSGGEVLVQADETTETVIEVEL